MNAPLLVMSLNSNYIMAGLAKQRENGVKSSKGRGSSLASQLEN